MRDGLVAILALLRRLPGNPVLARFLVARLFYTDGLNTLFAFGAIYAAGVFGMGFEEILLFGIALNLTAGLGAAGFGLVEDRMGSRRTVLVALGALTLCAAGLLVARGRSAPRVGWWRGPPGISGRWRSRSASSPGRPGRRAAP